MVDVANIERLLAEWENSKDFKDAASRMKPLHRGVMPRTYVGSRYGADGAGGVRLPRLLVMSINQSRQGQNISDDEVRRSLGTIKQNAQGRYMPDGFGPRALAANLSRWIFMGCGVPGDSLTPEAVHDMIAYDNFVKWAFDTPNGTPPKEAWPLFYRLNRDMIETIKPDILLCLGRPPYDHLWRALTKGDSRYESKTIVSNWAFCILAPWGRCEIGWCYHYSNPIYPNRAWRLIQDGKPVPPKIRGFVGDLVDTSPKALVEHMERIRNDEGGHPWWGQDVYEGVEYTLYNHFSRFVADRVCQALVRRWRDRSGE